MNSDWKHISLDQALHINPKFPMIKGDVYPFVDMQSVEVGHKYVSANEKREFKNSGSRFSDGDTLMARITPCLQNGKITRYRASNDQRDAHGSTEFIVLRNREGVTYEEFVYYLVISDQVKPYAIAQMNGSSGRQRVPVEAFKHLIVKLPPLSEQVAIANLLKSLDDKIELNRQMCKTLEDIASILFKSWFIDFDPVKAKAAGREPEGLSPEIAELFPVSFVDSSLGQIPYGWKVGKLKTIAQQIKSTIWPLNYPDEEFLHYSLPSYDSDKKPARDFGSSIKSNKTLIPQKCVLLSKLNPEIIRVWFPGQDKNLRSICSTEFLAYESKDYFICEYLYYLFLSPPFRSILEGMVTGTSKSHQRVQPTAILELNSLIPPENILKTFNVIIKSYLDKKETIKSQSHSLSQMRDLLLPALISDNLRIEEVKDIYDPPF